MITFPNWYEGGFPDRELVVLDLVQKYLDLLTPQGVACTWLPDDVTDLINAGVPVVRVYRGGMGSDGLFDAAAIQLGVLTATRQDSWAVMEYLRQVMLSFAHGGPVRHEDGSITMIASIDEVVGPQQIPDLNPDHRLVPATFRVECRLPRDRPDYTSIRASLPL
ncbi:phage tail termination protein [Nocardia australiensis]|uniref:phage tail termination protein n=1 Tax=Nocardia australiensis TaxID=2887191 RepID=UPI001D14F723|nr:hypothetical protein [Nocardia australiensis]